MRRFVFALFLALVPAAAHAQEKAPTVELPEFPNTTQVSVVGYSSQPVVMYSFSAPWCGPCQQMKETLADAEVAQCLAQNCKVIAVNIDEQKEVASKFQVDAIPAQVFVTADGKVIQKLVGLQDKGKFIATVKHVVANQPATSKKDKFTFPMASPSVVIVKTADGENVAVTKAVPSEDGKSFTVTIDGKLGMVTASDMRHDTVKGERIGFPRVIEVKVAANGTTVETGAQAATTTVMACPASAACATTAAAVNCPACAQGAKCDAAQCPAGAQCAAGQVVRSQTVTVPGFHVMAPQRVIERVVAPGVVEREVVEFIQSGADASRFTTTTVTATPAQPATVANCPVANCPACANGNGCDAAQCPAGAQCPAAKVVQGIRFALPHPVATDAPGPGRVTHLIKLRNVPAENVANAMIAIVQHDKLNDKRAVIVPEPITNSLVITADPQCFATIEKAATDLDKAAFVDIPQIIKSSQTGVFPVPQPSQASFPAPTGNMLYVSPRAVATTSVSAPLTIKPTTDNASTATPPAGAYCVVTTQGERHAYAGAFVRMTSEFIVIKENGTTHWIPRHSVECLSVTEEEEKVAEAPRAAVSATRVYPNPVAVPAMAPSYRPLPHDYAVPPTMAVPSTIAVPVPTGYAPMLPPAPAMAVPTKKMFHINLLMKQDGEVISSPQLITLESQKACVEVGDSNGNGFYCGIEARQVPNHPEVIVMDFFNAPDAEKACAQVTCPAGQTLTIPWKSSGKPCSMEVTAREHCGDQTCCQTIAQQCQTAVLPSPQFAGALAVPATAPEANPVAMTTCIYNIGQAKEHNVPILSQLPHVGRLFRSGHSVQEICEAIQACCPETWACNGGVGNIAVDGQSGCIVVCQTQEMQKQVAEIINKMCREQAEALHAIPATYEAPRGR